MTAFADMLSDDLSAVFLNTAEFAESISYWSKDAPGKRITITAVVHRHQHRDESEAFHRAETESIEIFVSNDADTGIDDPRVGDMIRLAEDSAEVRWSFVEELQRDENARYLRFRKTKLRQSGEKPVTR